MVSSAWSWYDHGDLPFGLLMFGTISQELAANQRHGTSQEWDDTFEQHQPALFEDCWVILYWPPILALVKNGWAFVPWVEQSHPNLLVHCASTSKSSQHHFSIIHVHESHCWNIAPNPNMRFWLMTFLFQCMFIFQVPCSFSGEYCSSISFVTKPSAVVKSGMVETP